MNRSSRSIRKNLLYLGILASLWTVPAGSAPAAEPPPGAGKIRVLLTADGTHSWDRKEPHFLSLLEEAGGFSLLSSNDLARWQPQMLKNFDLVVIHTTGGTLADEQANALKGFVEAGGGVVGIHCATDSFKNSDIYWELLGGRFTGHGGGKYEVEVIDPYHPTVAGLKGYSIEDEDYQHAYHPRADIRVLAKKKGDDRNMVWVKRVGKGRVFYIANGDNPGVFQNPAFRRILLAGMRWAAGCRVPPPREGEEGFRPLFDGKTLSGWTGDRKLWFVQEGILIGRSPGIAYNDFLCTQEEFEDFELRLQFRMLGGAGNSGIQIRSQKIPGHVAGYQADIGESYWGVLYDEARRNKVLAPAAKGMERAVEKDGWNEYTIRCEGDKVTLKLNGFTTVEYREEDTSIPRKGIIALQIHAGGPMEMQFAEIRIKPLGK